MLSCDVGGSRWWIPLLISISPSYTQANGLLLIVISPAVVFPPPKETSSLGLWDNYRGGNFRGLWLYPRDVAVVLVSRERLLCTAVILWNARDACWTTRTRAQLWRSLEDLDTTRVLFRTRIESRALVVIAGCTLSPYLADLGLLHRAWPP